MELGLGGRTALITGASQGLGLSIAHWFAREGCGLRIVARSPGPLEHAASALRAQHGVTVEPLAFDLSNEVERMRLVDACPDVDILINNAGNIPAGSIDQIDEAAWVAAWDLKVFGYISLTRAYFARMRAKGRGVIINVIGAAGERPTPGYIAGGMANLALMGFSQAIGAESPRYGVRVLGVNPGPIATDRLVRIAKKRAYERFGDEGRYEEIFETYPFGRPGTCDEVAATVVFLASDLSSYTSGTVVSIHGGSPHRPAV